MKSIIASEATPKKNKQIKGVVEKNGGLLLLLAFTLLVQNVTRAKAEDAPTVTSVNPSSGPIRGGTSVTITGDGFFGVERVDIGGTPCTSFSRVSSTSITCKTPSHIAGAVSVHVIIGSLIGFLSQGYTYQARPDGLPDVLPIIVPPPRVPPPRDIPICGSSIFDNSPPTCKNSGGDAYATHYVKNCLDYLTEQFWRKPKECSLDHFNNYKLALNDCAQKSAYQCQVGGGLSGVIGIPTSPYLPGTKLTAIDSAALNGCIYNKYQSLCKKLEHPIWSPPLQRMVWNCPNPQQECWNAIGDICRGTPAPDCKVPPQLQRDLEFFLK